MANNQIGELRRSAVVMTHAPGSIIDMRAGRGPVSGVCAGLEEWDLNAPLAGNLQYQKTIERRLCKKLGKRYFRLPPALEKDARRRDGTPDPAALVLRRFPNWLQCPACETIRPASKWKADPGHAYRYCAACSEAKPGREKVFVIPVRFVVACTAGHLEEFPWNSWVGHKPGCNNQDNLKLSSRGPGLSGLILECPACHAYRSFDGVFGEHALSGLKCRGGRPWLRSNDPSCDCSGDSGTYRVVQRGASNIYYPVMESALHIPRWTRKLETLLSDYWDILMDIVDRDGRMQYVNTSRQLTLAIQRHNLTAEKLIDLFEEMVNEAEAIDTDNMRIEEYKIFTSGFDEQDDEFETHQEPVPVELQEYIERVVRVARLREVRVVRGFTRIHPPDETDSSRIAPISNDTLDWLPGIDVRGEGIFIQLREDAVAVWEKRPAVMKRVGPLADQWQRTWQGRNPGEPTPTEITPRRLMLHSFSHALLRQLTLECGYSTASLRERLYFDNGPAKMLGVLIYTATSDSDGTLGGLQRRASPPLLGPTILGALQSARWCSSDPLCVSGEISSPEYNSIASCHACMLLPETSCELHNQFLDRALISESEDAIGFFAPLIR